MMSSIPFLSGHQFHSIPCKCGCPNRYPSRDIHARTIYNRYPSNTNIHTNRYPCFMDISLNLSIILRISIWIFIYFYGYPCMNMLWILDPRRSCLLLEMRIETSSLGEKIWSYKGMNINRTLPLFHNFRPDYNLTRTRNRGQTKCKHVRK